MRGFFVRAGYMPHFLQNLGHSGMHRPSGPQASMPAYAVRACPSVLPTAHIWFALNGLGLTAHTVMLAWFPMIKWGLMDCQAQPVPNGYRPPYQQASMAQSYATPPPQNYMQRTQVRFFPLSTHSWHCLPPRDIVCSMLSFAESEDGCNSGQFGGRS